MNFMIPPEQDIQAIAKANGKAARYGLTLTAEQMTLLAESRGRALRDTGRVEMGGGILPRLMETFCDSPYLHQAEYPETLEALQTLFYRCKNEAGDLTADEAVLRCLRRAFDKAGGSASYLEGKTFGEMVSWLKEGETWIN